MTTLTETHGTNAKKEKILPGTGLDFSSSLDHNIDVNDDKDTRHRTLAKEEEWDSIAKEVVILALLFSATDSGTGKDKKSFVNFIRRVEKHAHIEEKIEKKYDEIKELNKKLADDPDNDKLKTELEIKYNQLETLQKQEAEQFEERFRESLEFPMGEGYETLNEAKQMLDDHEDTSPQDTSS